VGNGYSGVVWLEWLKVWLWLIFFYRFCAGAKFASADSEFVICKITHDLHLTLAYPREDVTWTSPETPVRTHYMFQMVQ